MSRLKIEGARRQLGTALALFLRDEDPVSVHCLAGGGCELIDFYAKKAGATPVSSYILQTHPNLDVGTIRKTQRQYWTAFKHATHSHSGKERDDDELLAEFSDLENDHALFIGWYDYALATDSLPVEAQLFQIWYVALYPEALHESLAHFEVDEIFPDLRNKPRPEQKRELREAIEKVRKDSSVMDSSYTDKRPLVIDWP